MKKIFTSFLLLLCCSIAVMAQSITATDYTFESVSIKGQTQVTATADIPVSWTGIPADARTVYAEVKTGVANPDGFYIAGDNYFYTGYGDKMKSSTTFKIGFVATKAGSYTGTVRFYTTYDANWEQEVEKVITLRIEVTSSAIVPTTTTYTKVTAVSQLAEGDVVVLAYESASTVAGALNGAYLTAVTDGVKFDKTNNTVEIPADAETFTLSKYNGNWQFTATSTGKTLKNNVSGSGAFTYSDATTTILAGWGISITSGDARISRPSDDSFPILYNTSAPRFKPYKSEGAGVLPQLYKKTSNAHQVTSTLTLTPATIDFGTLEQGEQKSLEMTYTAENLTDDIVWALEGADAEYFKVKDTGDRTAGKVTLTYEGKATKLGALNAKLSYLTQDIQLDAMEGSFPIAINLVATTVKVQSIIFEAAEKTVLLGETLDLGKAITILPADAVDKSLTWTSSNNAYATVDENGVVTPHISGSVTITVASKKVPQVTATCKVTIKVPDATGVQLDNSTLTLNIGGKQTLVATVLPAGAKQDVTWTVADNTIATISNKGVVTAKALGTTTVTATAKGTEYSATCQVNVVPVTVESIAFAQTSISLSVGGGVQLQPIITPASAAADNTVTYKSADESIVTVSETGLVKALKEGETTITASVAGKTATITIVVRSATMFALVTDPTVLKDKDTILIGRHTADWEVMAGKINGKSLTAIKDNLTFTADAAASDDAARYVLGATTGGFTLTAVGASKAIAENGNVFAEANTKNNKVWKFEADENGVYVHNVGNENAYIKYMVSSGLIRPYKAGSIGAEMLYVYYRPYIEPAHQTVHVTGITLTLGSYTAEEGQEFVLRATVSPANADDKSVVWSSSDESIATVNAGTVKALKEGACTITATTVDGGFKATCTLTVKKKELLPTPKPQFSVAAGEVTRGTEVKVSATATDTVYVSLNGGAWQYALSEFVVTIDQETEIEAYAIREGYLKSENIRARYTLKADGTGTDNIEKSEPRTRKVLINGMIYIIKGDKKYNVLGAEVESLVN